MPTTTITIRDETTSRHAPPINVFALPVAAERLTVRELIRTRVTYEVEKYNQQQTDHFNGFVQPVGAEKVLNGYRLRTPRSIDVEEQCARAFEAFAGNGFIVLINDQQADDLEQVVDLTSETTIAFLKLVPLVGG